MEAILERLQQSDEGIDEVDEELELELEGMKQQAVLQLRENEDREKEIRTLDLKISLLVKNRLSLEALTSEYPGLAENGSFYDYSSAETDFAGGGGTGVDPDLRTPNEAFARALPGYQHLFYLLQTEPKYLARLIRLHKSSANVQKFMQNIVLSLFGFAQESREEFLLLSLFKQAIEEEMADISEPQEVLLSNPIILDLLVRYSRTVNEHSFLIKLLRPLVMAVLDVPDLDLDLDPVSIYYNKVANRESATGEKSEAPYEVNATTALEDDEVREILSKNMAQLLKIADKFLAAFFASIEVMPFGIRFIANELYQCLKVRFPNPEDEEKLTRVVGNVIFFRYINPAIVVPDAFNVVTQQLSLIQRKNLTSISRILLNMSMAQLVSDFYLVPMNSYITEAHQKFLEYFRRVINRLPTLEEHFKVSEFAEILAVSQPPTVYISAEEVVYAHWLVKEEVDRISDGKGDILRDILKELGEPLGEKHIKKGKPVALSLTPRLGKLDEKDIDARTNFIHVKKFSQLLIRVQQAPTLLELLELPTTPNDERNFGQVVSQRLKKGDGGKKRIRSQSLAVIELLPPTMISLKNRCKTLLASLEDTGMVTKASGYKEILDAILQDLVDKSKRKRQRGIEIERLTQSLKELEQTKKILEEKRQIYVNYVKSCINNMHTGKRRRLTLSQNGKVTSSANPFESVTFQADKLFAKGVLLDIKGVPENQRNKVTITITPTGSGTFQIVGTAFGVHSGLIDLRLEDLLENKFNRVPHITVFDDTVQLSVNLLIHLLNKTFFL